MRVLFCSQCELDPRLGAAGALLSLAASLERIGCQCRLVGPREVGAGYGDYEAKLQTFLAEQAAEYDVVDCDFGLLPRDRRVLPDEVLVVARVQLLLHQYVLGQVQRPRLDRGFTWWLRYRKDLAAKRLELPHIEERLRAADAVVVLNPRDKALLVSRGFPEGHIHVLPNGLGLERRQRLLRLAVTPPAVPRVAFIGNFGPRKGSLDLPYILSSIASAVPQSTFLLLGTGPQYTVERLRRFFPAAIRPRLDVIPTYQPDDLADALASCSIGVFPSYAEGFGLAVIEMLAAAVPVFAYDAPGPGDILPARFLTQLGNRHELSRRASALLLDAGRLREERARCRSLVAPYNWDQIAVEVKEMFKRERVNSRLLIHESADFKPHRTAGPDAAGRSK